MRPNTQANAPCNYPPFSKIILNSRPPPRNDILDTPPCIGTVRWYRALVPCAGTVRWDRALGPCAGTVRWNRALGPCAGTVRWDRALVPCAGTVRWYRALVPCAGTVRWYRTLVNRLHRSTVDTEVADQLFTNQ